MLTLVPAGWSAKVVQVTNIAQIQPHAAHSTFTHCWLYLCRTMPNISELLQPLEDSIWLVLIPFLTGCSPPNDTIHNLFALPPCFGGLGLINPAAISTNEFSASHYITEPLSSFIPGQDTNSFVVKTEQLSRKSTTHHSKASSYSEQSSGLWEHLDPPLQHAWDLATAKGASSWLTTCPLGEHEFALHKLAFQDAIALYYGWSPKHTPTHCVLSSIQHT